MNSRRPVAERAASAYATSFLPLRFARFSSTIAAGVCSDPASAAEPMQRQIIPVRPFVRNVTEIPNVSSHKRKAFVSVPRSAVFPHTRQCPRCDFREPAGGNRAPSDAVTSPLSLSPQTLPALWQEYQTLRKRRNNAAVVESE